MENICDGGADNVFGADSCICHPTTTFEGVELEHGLLGLLQLLGAGYLVWWLRRQQREAVLKESTSSLLVLPVYAKFLTFEAWQSGVWGAFYLFNVYYDTGAGSTTHTPPRSFVVLMQVARYLSSFTWALCGEGVFMFLCFDSAGIESLHSAVRLGATWALVLLGGCAFLWLSWAGCTPPPDFDGPRSLVMQAMWVGAWVPYWMRLCVMPLLYGPALLLLLLPSRRAVAWERGALHLCLFNLAMSLAFLLPKVALGVFTPKWLLADAVATPLAWLVYVPFLAWVLQRDSAFWLRCGFTACVLGDRTANNGAADGGDGQYATPHRVPLLSRVSSSSLGDRHAPRFMIIDPSTLRWSHRIGRGATSVVSAATLYGEPVAVKQMEVKQLTRAFASMFLTEAECLSHCRHPHIVRFVGGCVAPPLVCLVMEVCDSSVHRLLHPHGASSVEPPLPPAQICALLRDVASGMQFLHGTMGVVHGDLKPLNLLLHDGQIKLCDFGSSRLLRHGVSELAYTGTLPYMAAELLREGAGASSLSRSSSIGGFLSSIKSMSRSASGALFARSASNQSLPNQLGGLGGASASASASAMASAKGKEASQSCTSLAGSSHWEILLGSSVSGAHGGVGAEGVLAEGAGGGVPSGPRPTSEGGGLGVGGCGLGGGGGGGGGGAPGSPSKFGGPASPAHSQHGGSQFSHSQFSTRGAGAHPTSYAVDVFSFGVCVWELCTRRFPWHTLLEQGRVAELRRRVGRDAERPDASECPAALRVLAEACWRQAPSQRPTFDELARLDLANLCSSEQALRELEWLATRRSKPSVGGGLSRVASVADATGAPGAAAGGGGGGGGGRGGATGSGSEQATQSASDAALRLAIGLPPGSLAYRPPAPATVYAGSAPPPPPPT